MNLMTLVRLLVLLVLAWIVVALGVGVLGVGTNESTGATFYVPTPSLVDTFTLGRLDHPSSAQHRLIDRATGRVEPLWLPEDKAWSLLSVSPWRDQQRIFNGGRAAGSAGWKDKSNSTGWGFSSCPVEHSRIASHSKFSPLASRAGSPAGPMKYCFRPGTQRNCQ